MNWGVIMFDIKKKNGPVKIGLLGASFTTGNFGVNALAETSIKCIRHTWPNSEIFLLASGRHNERCEYNISGNMTSFQVMPIRFCPNIFLGNHILVLSVFAFLLNVIKSEKFRNFCCRHNSSVRRLYNLDVVADITAGDSFSDIYGMKRFLKGFMIKWVLLSFNKPLVMLPQTYGPFKSRIAGKMAAHILKKARLVYSRDFQGKELVISILGQDSDNKVRHSHDLAFVLDPIKPKNTITSLFDELNAGDKIIVGLNISGLLYSGGYTKRNMFNLKIDYSSFVPKLIEMLMADKRVIVLLVPHVFPPKELKLESDLEACRKVHKKLVNKYPDRLYIIDEPFTHNEIKFMIGKCAFFIGSRMHSCIAAISQCVPAVGLSYSKKFRGVFEALGLGNCVADAANCPEEWVLEKIKQVFHQRSEIQSQLNLTIPDIKTGILNILTEAMDNTNYPHEYTEAQPAEQSSK